MRLIFEVMRDVRLLRVPLTVLVWALAGWGAFVAFSGYPLLDTDGFWMAVRIVVGLLAVFFWGWFRSAGRRASVVGLLLFEHALIGFFVVGMPIMACLFSWAVVFNGLLDTSPPVSQQAVVEQRAMVSGFRGSKTLVVSVRDARKSGDLLRFAAGNGQPWITTAQPGDRLSITTRAGALGWRWFTQVVPVQGAPE